MTIAAYTGLPGHGKSYGVVENVIIPALKDKRILYTNIPMNHELCLNDFGMVPIPFHTDDILKNPYWFRDVFQAGAILVLDECWRVWPAGLKATGVQESHKEFLAEHRHLVGENGKATEIYLVTQDLSQVAAFVRALVENTFRVTKLISLGISKGYRVDVYFGAVTGTKPNPKNREREIFGKFSKQIYKYYKSHTKSQTGEAGDETRTDKRFGVLGRLSIKLGILLFFVLAIFIYFGAKDVSKGFHPESKTVAPDPVSTSTQGKPVTAASSSGSAVAVHAEIPMFLAKARRLFVGYSIGTRDAVENYYVVVFDDYEATLSGEDLKALGYKLVLVTECVVRVTGADYSGYFMCAKHAQKKEGLLAGVANDVSNVGDKIN